MNCYNHRTVAAIGVCKNCNKGLCPDCITDVENGIACTTTCVEEVKTLNALINKNKNATDRVSSSYNRSAFIYFAVGILFISTGLFYPELKFYMFFGGGIFILGALLMLNTAKKYKKA